MEQIENRLRQLEHEEMNRMVARSHILAAFRRLLESAEAEERYVDDDTFCITRYSIFSISPPPLY